jgi:hypothetical protein
MEETLAIAMTPVRWLKAGDRVGSPSRWLYEVTGDAQAGPGGTVTCEVRFADGKEDVRTWLHGMDAEVAVQVRG